MDLRQLVYFVAVAREQQFLRAADSLCIAQSAVSHQIRLLEDELRVDLFVRDRRGARLTHAGEVLYAHATRILASVEDARADIDRLTGLLVGRLRVGAGAPTGPVRLARALRDFRLAHPGIEIVVIDGSAAELLRRLTVAELDVAIVSRMPDDLPPDIDGLMVGQEPFVVLVPETNALASERELRLEQLGGEELVAFPHGASIRAVLDSALLDAGVTPPIVVAETTDPAMLLDLVAHRVGIAVVPESFATLVSPSVKVARLLRTRLVRPRTLAWARDRRASPALAAFLEFIPSVMAQG